MKKKIYMNITFEQLVEAIKQLTPNELEKIKQEIIKEELLKRSLEVKKGSYLKLEEMKSLKNV